MKKTPVIFVALFLLYPTLLLAGEKVTAKGMSFMEPGREVIAREKALDEAKRTAIEKAMGVAVQSNSIVEDYQVVKDQIFTRTSGYLKDVTILSEKKTELGTYEVEISTEVEIAALIEDIDRLKNILNWQKNPRISVRLEPGINPAYLATAQKAANLLIKKLNQNGFSVFRPEKADQIEMGLLVALSLDLSSQKSKYQDLEITLNEVSLSANIYRPGEGEILGAASAVKSLPGENRLHALDQGTRQCVDEVWKHLRRDLIRLWEKELYSARDLVLVVRQVPSLVKAQELMAIFKSDVSGVLDINLITLKKRNAEYGLKYRGWPDQFINEIQMTYFKQKYFDPELESVSGNRIVIRMQ